MKKFLLLLSLTMTTAYAHDLSYGPYLKMQEALADDDLKTALDAHKVICEKELMQYKVNYKNCDKTFKDIEEVRTSFKTLSDIYIEKGNKKELQTLDKATCPMAKAKWIQRNGNIKNPYYGESMLECGEKL